MYRNSEILKSNTRGQATCESKGTILVIDDQECIRNVTNRFLNKLGYRVIAANSGEEAIRIFGKEGNDIDLAIIDMVMPDINGRETYSILRKIKYNLLAIFVSGYDESDLSITHGIKQNSISFLHKPFTRDLLAQKVSGLLNKHHHLMN